MKKWIFLAMLPLLGCGPSEQQTRCEEAGGSWKAQSTPATGIDPASGKVVVVIVTTWYCEL